MKQKFISYIVLFVFLICYFYTAQGQNIKEDLPLTVKVDFTKTLQDWDGFGINYVELAQSTDPVNDPQDYGGFSFLTEEKRQEIIDLIFGEEGLKVQIIKMFLDPFHQKEPESSFDHKSTTAWMRYFVHHGIQRNKAWGGQNIEIITTLYGPPDWATKQKILRGRDLDPTQYENLSRYMIDWVKFLVEEEHLPVKYLSLHNEGDSPNRWPPDGSHGNIGTGQDYNAFWRPWELAYFLEFMPPMIKKAGLEIGLTPGECTTWRHFSTHWYHWAIHDNEKAMNNLGLITSHGFGSGDAINSDANDLLRLKQPGLHAWTTSMTWGGQKGIKDCQFVEYIRRNIYDAKVNAVIPWSALQTLTWIGGDPNPGTAFFISEEGNYEVRPQYYFYKQLTLAGQRGMKVASVETGKDQDVGLIAFESNGTDHPNAFIVLNKGDQSKKIEINVIGSDSSFIAFRSSTSEKYYQLGLFSLSEGKLVYEAPGGSVSTFFSGTNLK